MGGYVTARLKLGGETNHGWKGITVFSQIQLALFEISRRYPGAENVFALAGGLSAAADYLAEKYDHRHWKHHYLIKARHPSHW